MSTTSLPFARACLLAGAFALTACPADEQTTTDTDPTAATDNTTSTTTDGTTSTSETSAPTTTEGTTEGTTDGTTDPTTDSDTESTMGGVDPAELDAPCESLCEKFIECDYDPSYSDVESCKANCLSITPGGLCIAPSVAYYNCVGQMTCEELLSEDWVSCAEEEEGLPEECGEPDCEDLGSSEGPDTCSYGYLCPNSVAEEMRCEGDTCTCLVDGEVVGTCGASEGFCALEQYEKADIAFECCGFEF